MAALWQRQASGGFECGCRPSSCSALARRPRTTPAMAAGLQERPWTILAVARRMDPDREIVAPSSRYPACPCLMSVGVPFECVPRQARQDSPSSIWTQTGTSGWLMALGTMSQPTYVDAPLRTLEGPRSGGVRGRGMPPEPPCRYAARIGARWPSRQGIIWTGSRPVCAR